MRLIKTDLLISATLDLLGLRNRPLPVPSPPLSYQKRHYARQITALDGSKGAAVIKANREETSARVDWLIQMLWLQGSWLNHGAPRTRHGAPKYPLHPHESPTRYMMGEIRRGVISIETRMFNRFRNRRWADRRSWFFFLLKFMMNGWKGCIGGRPHLLSGGIPMEYLRYNIFGKLVIYLAI